MKRSLCIAGLLSVCISANAQWVQQVTNTNAHLTSIHFPSSTTGYIAGDFGGYGGYLKTTDGGSTWSSELITFAPFISIHFANTDTGSAVGYGVFFRTTDGGATWSNPAPAGNYMSDVWNFTGDRLITASSSDIHKSINGGTSWSTISDSVIFESFFFLDQSTGYAAGWDGSFAYRGVISKTTDQGATWTHQFFHNYTVVSSIHFPSAGVGYAAGSSRVMKTSDGGSTWSFLNVDSVNNTYTDVFFSSDTRGHVTGQNGQGYPFIMSTNDGGNTWVTQVLGNTMRIMRSVWCTDNNTCFAAGDSGMVFRTVNAGGVGLNEVIMKSNVNAYPNPFSESVMITFNGSTLSNGMLQVYDVYGRSVRTVSGLKGNEVMISRDDLAAGVYLYVLSDGGQVIGSGKLTAQ